MLSKMFVVCSETKQQKHEWRKRNVTNNQTNATEINLQLAMKMIIMIWVNTLSYRLNVIGALCHSVCLAIMFAARIENGILACLHFSALTTKHSKGIRTYGRGRACNRIGHFALTFGVELRKQKRRMNEYEPII